MKGKTLMIIGVLAAAAGVLLMLFCQSIKSTGVIVAGGVLFLAVGLLNLIFFNQGDASGGVGRAFTQITNAASIVLGLTMILYQNTFVPLVTFMFGLLIVVSAVWQFFTLALGTRPYQLPGWLYIFPVLIAGTSIYVFMQRGTADESRLMLASGIGIALLGLGCLLEGVSLGSARHAAKKAAKSIPTPEQLGADKQWSEPTVTPPVTETEARKSEPETTEDLDDE